MILWTFWSSVSKKSVVKWNASPSPKHVLTLLFHPFCLLVSWEMLLCNCLHASLQLYLPLIMHTLLRMFLTLETRFTLFPLFFCFLDQFILGHSYYTVTGCVYVCVCACVCVCVCVCVCPVAQLCPTLFDPMDCSTPESSVHGIFPARILGRVAISCSRGSSWPRDWSHVSYISCIGRRILYHCATDLKNQKWQNFVWV